LLILEADREVINTQYTMLMNKGDRDEITQLMKDALSTHTTIISGQFKLIAADLSHIKEQTQKTNGRVTKLEEQRQASLVAELTHFQNCPIADKVELLEQDRASRKNLNRFFVALGSAVVGTAAVIAVIVEIVKSLK
jgi:hypothetical protein